jgi:predicted MFS family arabinose efflux permease
VYAAMSGAGAAVGLILGGWLTGSTGEILGATVEGWRFTFLINVPIGLVAAALAPRVLAESETHSGELDVPGAVSGTAGLLAIVYGLSRAGNPDYGWGDAWTLATLGGGVALLLAFGAIESRAEHPLLPFRVLQDRTRAASFVAMMLLPAAMFAMFFYLSLYIQNVMGYSPLKAGVAFLPFSIGIVVAAGMASSLLNKVDPRYLAGVGTLLAAGGLYGFSRIPHDVAFPATEIVASYLTDVLPYVVMMSVGMGLTFVPVTLTAVHGVAAQDSGIGSGVLNTMQQVGGALGLATLSTVAQSTWTDTGQKLASSAETAAAAGPAGAPTPSSDQLEALQQIAELQVFTHGATTAFLVGAGMAVLGSLVVWIFLDVSHQDLATDGAEGGVHV